MYTLTYMVQVQLKAPSSDLLFQCLQTAFSPPAAQKLPVLNYIINNTSTSTLEFNDLLCDIFLNISHRTGLLRKSNLLQTEKL